jgi:hypothetical protein
MNAMDEMPQELLAGIGEIIARWGYLHFQVGVVVREVAQIADKKTGRVLTFGPELGVLCNQLLTMTKTDHWVKDATLRKEIETFAKNVQDAASHRNDYAHGIFGFGEKPGTFVRFLMKAPSHRISPETEELTVQRLAELAKEAAELWLRAQHLTVRLKASRQKQP